MMFLFQSGGDVSDIAYEIAQETCPYFKVDMWGMLTARYDLNILPYSLEPENIQSMYEAEVRRKIPVLPIDSLQSKF